jgi:CheY-like chemotaxis protein
MAEENAGPVRPAEPALAAAEIEPWNVLFVEDNKDARRLVGEYFHGRPVEGRQLAFQEIEDWDRAFSLIREHKADLVILDIYRGDAHSGGDRVGEQILNALKNSGFVPTVVYTNLPEGLDKEQNEFIRVVTKVDGLKALHTEVERIFKTKVPQMHRAIVNHVDRVLCRYMWGFVVQEWPALKEIADKPEFLRLLVQRLALSFVREGIEETISEVFGGAKDHPPPDRVHPAEFYIKPPIGSDPVLGDIRSRQHSEEKEFLVVLWPTCDMVSTHGRTPKTEIVLCARAFRLETFPEAKKYGENQTKSTYDQLESLLDNDRKKHLGSPDRFHFLPGILDIPNLVIDFQALEILPFKDVQALSSSGSLASPFAELLGSRFDRYRGRIGTPDLDYDLVIRETTAGKPGPPAPPAASRNPQAPPAADDSQKQPGK